MRPHRSRAVALAALVTFTSACASWQVAEVPPRTLIQDEQPTAVRVTRLDGTRVIVRDPSVRNDSIMGTVTGGTDCSTRLASGGCLPLPDRVLQAPLSDLDRVEVRAPSASRTFAAVILVPATIIGVMALILRGQVCCY